MVGVGDGTYSTVSVMEGLLMNEQSWAACLNKASYEVGTTTWVSLKAAALAATVCILGAVGPSQTRSPGSDHVAGVSQLVCA